MTLRLTRRDALCCGAIGLGATAGGLLCAPAVAAQQEAAKPGSSFTFCLNTGTIRGFKLSLVEEIDLTAKAGYQGIEVWMDNVHRHVESGGSLAEVKKRTSDQARVLFHLLPEHRHDSRFQALAGRGNRPDSQSRLPRN